MVDDLWCKVMKLYVVFTLIFLMCTGVLNIFVNLVINCMFKGALVIINQAYSHKNIKAPRICVGLKYTKSYKKY